MFRSKSNDDHLFTSKTSYFSKTTSDSKKIMGAKGTQHSTKNITTKTTSTSRSSKIIRNFKVKDSHDADAIAQVVTHIISPSGNHPSSIATTTTTAAEKPVSKKHKLHQECLLSLRVANFEFSGTITNTTPTNTSTLSSSEKHGIFGSTAFSKFNPKRGKHQVKYICITRGTTHPLLKRKTRASSARHTMGGKVLVSYSNNQEEYEEFIDADDTLEHATGESEDDSEEEDDNEENDDYSLLYNPDTTKEMDPVHDDNEEDEMHGRDHRLSAMMKQKSPIGDLNITHDENYYTSKGDEYQWEQEVSSFPQLVCLAVEADGSNPHVKRVFDLDQLVAIDSVAKEGKVKLVFQNGSIVEIDCAVEEDGTGILIEREYGSSGEPLQKSRFLWSLLQIHAILCISVVERNASRIGSDISGGASTGRILARKLNTNLLPPLTMRNIEKSELQYVSTMNGFLTENPMLLALLERQRNITVLDKGLNQSGIRGKTRGISSHEEKSSGSDEMNGIAYDMIMGNFNNMTLFFNDEEKKDAEEVFNSIFRPSEDNADDKDESEGKFDFDDIETSDVLTNLLRNKMRMLEAETCRRLIAWEDEKVYAASGIAPDKRDTVESLSLANLFSTLDTLEKELENMEEWLLDKAAAIKPLTDDCQEVEEENRQIEQQKYSFELLSIELERLLDCLEIDKDVENILKNPKSHLEYNSHGSIKLEQSGSGVEDIYRAGKVLKQAFDKVYEDKGIHLRSVSERVEGLLQISNTFCENVANIIISVMKEAAKTAVENDVGIEVKNISHTAVAKCLRNVSISLSVHICHIVFPIFSNLSVMNI